GVPICMNFKNSRIGLRAVTMVEGAKGTVVLLAGIGMLNLLHRDVAQIAARLISRMHLNPARRIPEIFLKAAAQVNDGRLRTLAGFACVYAGIRFLQAYGLWHERRWAEWLTIVTAALYLPLEFGEIYVHCTWIKLVATGINLLILAYLIYVIFFSP